MAPRRNARLNLCSRPDYPHSLIARASDRKSSMISARTGYWEHTGVVKGSALAGLDYDSSPTREISLANLRKSLTFSPHNR